MITYQMHRRIESESPREYLNSTTVKVMFFRLVCVCACSTDLTQKLWTDLGQI